MYENICFIGITHKVTVLKNGAVHSDGAEMVKECFLFHVSDGTACDSVT